MKTKIKHNKKPKKPKQLIKPWLVWLSGLSANKNKKIKKKISSYMNLWSNSEKVQQTTISSYTSVNLEKNLEKCHINWDADF